MRRIACLVALTTLVAPAGAATGAVHRTSVGVGLREFRVGLYRDHVRPGVVKLNLQNFGEDPHDLVVRTLSGRIVARGPVVRSGDRQSFSVRLPRPGRFVVFCSLADHEQRGMHARLVVSRRARP